nr:immunoglobulin light chain junction region [Mus musculus]
CQQWSSNPQYTF